MEAGPPGRVELVQPEDGQDGRLVEAERRGQLDAGIVDEFEVRVGHGFGEGHGAGSKVVGQIRGLADAGKLPGLHALQDVGAIAGDSSREVIG